MPDETSAGDTPACVCCGCDCWRPAGQPHRGASIAPKTYDDFRRVADVTLPRPVAPAESPGRLEPTFEEEPPAREQRQADLFGGTP
jgi:hypothetical protein